MYPVAHEAITRRSHDFARLCTRLWEDPTRNPIIQERNKQKTRRFLKCMYGIFCKYAEVRCSGLCAQTQSHYCNSVTKAHPTVVKYFNQKLSPGKRGIQTAMLSRLLKKLGRSSVAQSVTEMWPFWNI